MTSAGISHLRPFPLECPCFHPLSVELYPVRWFSAYFRAEPVKRDRIELRQSSPREASLFQDKARHVVVGASIGVCRRPTGTLSHECVSSLMFAAICAGSATSCRSLLDSVVSKRLELGGFSGLSEFGDSDSLFSSSAAQEDSAL